MHRPWLLFLFISLQVWARAHFTFGLAADVIFLLLFICYNIAGHVVVVSTIVHFDLFPVPALVLSIEEVSLLLKCE